MVSSSSGIVVVVDKRRGLSRSEKMGAPHRFSWRSESIVVEKKVSRWFRSESVINLERDWAWTLASSLIPCNT